MSCVPEILEVKFCSLRQLPFRYFFSAIEFFAVIFLFRFILSNVGLSD